jgi:FkbM family methyltransferase
MSPTRSTASQYLRRIARRTLRNTVFRRRLPRDIGNRSIYVTPASALGVLKPRFENFDPRLFHFVRTIIKRDDIVWDVGANMGVFAFSAAAKAGPQGRIISFEADPCMAALIHRTERRRDPSSAPVDVICVAVSNQQGVERLCVTPDAGQQHLESGASTVAWTSSFPVLTVTLDDMLSHFPAPTVLKADIEGAEVAMFQGARRLLTEVRPYMLVEVKIPNIRKVADILHQHDYAIFDAENPKRGELDQCAYESFLVPRERVGAESRLTALEAEAV